MDKKELTEEQTMQLLFNIKKDSYNNFNIVRPNINNHYIDSLTNKKTNDIANLAKSNFTKKTKKIKNNLKVKRR